MNHRTLEAIGAQGRLSLFQGVETSAQTPRKRFTAQSQWERLQARNARFLTSPGSLRQCIHQPNSIKRLTRFIKPI
jgi:hypothetical protein